MDLRTRVVFHITTEFVTESYNLNGHFAGTRKYETNVKDLNGFSKFVTNLTNSTKFGEHDINKGTYCIKIKRNVIVYDEDDRQTFRSATFPGKELSVILSTTDKLLYISDIEPLLQTKFPKFCIEQSKFIDTRPIYLEYFDGRNVKYRHLQDNDIVIDSKLNQIFGKNPQISLIDFFNTKERLG